MTTWWPLALARSRKCCPRSIWGHGPLDWHRVGYRCLLVSPGWPPNVDLHVTFYSGPTRSGQKGLYRDRYTVSSVICFCHWSLLLTLGPWFYIKMASFQYRKYHCGDKTVVRSSYLHNGISYTDKMASYLGLISLCVVCWLSAFVDWRFWKFLKLIRRHTCESYFLMAFSWIEALATLLPWQIGSTTVSGN